jgi:hypothetical protein
VNASSDVRFSRCEPPRCTITSQKKDSAGFSSVRTVLRRGALWSSRAESRRSPEADGQAKNNDDKIANVCLELEVGASGPLLLELGLRGEGIESMEMWDRQGQYGRLNRPTTFEMSDPIISILTDAAWKEDAIAVRFVRKGGLSEHDGMHVLVVCRARGGSDVRSASDCAEARFVPSTSPDLEHPKLKAGVLTVHLRSMTEDFVGRAFTEPLAAEPPTRGLRSRSD